MYKTAFQSLKKKLCSHPVVHSSDFSKPFVLQTDASDRAVGAMLSQEGDGGQEHAVAYFSKKLLPREETFYGGYRMSSHQAVHKSF